MQDDNGKARMWTNKLGDITVRHNWPFVKDIADGSFPLTQFLCCWKYIHVITSSWLKRCIAISWQTHTYIYDSYICRLNQWGLMYEQWASYQKRKIASYMRWECLGLFPHHRLPRKPLVSDTDMHHCTCVTHVPWCMSGSLTRGGEENVPNIPGACAMHNFAYLVKGPSINTRSDTLMRNNTASFTCN